MIRSIAVTLIALEARLSILTAAFALPSSSFQPHHAHCRHRTLPIKPIRTSSKLFKATISNIETASVSVAGVDPDSAGKVNQDIAFHSCRELGPDDRFVFGGVLDGHGKKGHVLNAFLGAYIPKYLQKSLDAFANANGEGDGPSLIEDILVDTFESAHMAARMDETVPAGRSGTTCVITVVDLECGIVYTGNVGDSRSILATTALDTSNGMNGDDSEWEVIALSTETTTAIEDEKKRIEQNEGRIDSGGNVWYGPVAIAMTRALGDAVMTRAGILHVPTLSTLDLNDLDGYESGGCVVRIIIGSDGIFDVLKNEEANSHLNGSSDSLQLRCERLVHEARKKWRSGLPMDVRIDDTSAAVISFQCTK